VLLRAMVISDRRRLRFSCIPSIAAARHLVCNHGVASEELVGVRMGRGVGMVVAVLGGPSAIAVHNDSVLHTCLVLD
jgi:hypothetical protein